MAKKDKRVKGCPNKDCTLFKKEKYTLEDHFCKSCGEELVIVCSKCLGPIEDIDPSHSICEGCRLKAEQNKEQFIDGAKKVGAGLATIGTIAIGVLNGAKQIKK